MLSFMCFKHLHKGHHPILDLLQTSLYSAQHFKRFIQLNICRMSSFILNSIVWVQPLYLFLTVWRDEFILLIQSVLSWIHLYKYLLHICEDCITSKFLGIELLDFRAYVCILLLDFIKLLSVVVIWDRNIFWHYWDKWKYFKALWFSLYIYPEMISHREWHRCATLRPLHCPFHAAYCGAHGIVTALLSKAIFKRFYLFIFRERGREGERQGETHQRVVASPTPPTGDLAHNPGMCPDWELNQRPFGSQPHAQSTEPHQPGPRIILTVE